jgi:hypothetical protein
MREIKHASKSFRKQLLVFSIIFSFVATYIIVKTFAASGGLSATTISSSQINLSWALNPDSTKAMSYDIYRDRIKIASVVSTSFGDTGLTPSTTYNYYVKAHDANEKYNLVSNTVHIATSSLFASGSLTGAIVNSSGKPIAYAKLSLTSPKNKHVFTYTSSRDGTYSIPNLKPGSYSLKFSAKGFNPRTETATITSNNVTIANVNL